MDLNVRKDALRVRHETLESKIGLEERRPCPDEIHLQELKKKKLKIKDQLSSLEDA